MIYKFTTSQKIISKILSDLDISEESIRLADLKEWCGEAIEKIGSVKQFNRKILGENGVEPLTLSGYQAQLPSDLHKMNQLMYSINSKGPWFPMTVATGSFDHWDVIPDEVLTQGTATPDAVIIAMIHNIYESMADNFIYTWYNQMTEQEAIDIMKSDSAASKELRRLIMSMLQFNGSTSNVTREIGFKYRIDGTSSKIISNMKTGFIKMSYDAMYTDENGYPLIPDLISYIEAVYWYVVMKLKYPEYLSGRLNREVYYDIRRSWNFYCKQAYGESMMPNEDEMETIKNVWLKLVPDIYANESGYVNLGEPERIKNLNRRNVKQVW
jgi:hypothetical protein